MKGTDFKIDRLRRAAGWLLAALVLAAGTSAPARQLGEVPDSMELTKGVTTGLKLNTPLEARIEEESAQVSLSRDERLDDGSMLLSAQEEGSAYLVLSLMGVPVKKVNVTVSPERILTPGGQSIGVALNMAGVLVVGASDVGAAPSPARQAGLRSGDLIVAVNGQSVTSAAELTELIGAGGRSELSVERAGRRLSVGVDPVKDQRDGVYRLGAWVRDSTAGVGTLSYYDPKTRRFAALGHAITDADTGTLLTVSEGSIYESRIVEVLKGSAGEPGELLGEFFEEARHLGDVDLNCDYGLYGQSDEPVVSALYPDGVPILTRSEVRLGPAQILTTLDDGGVRAYNCEITKLFRQDGEGQRGMVVKITDEELLRRTGGIVQGMSGSPILQSGRLAGAITHVFVGDPTQGYGMYVEWMLEKSDGLDAGADQAA